MVRHQQTPQAMLLCLLVQLVQRSAQRGRAQMALDRYHVILLFTSAHTAHSGASHPFNTVCNNSLTSTSEWLRKSKGFQPQ
jgi:hypothetical protein